MQKIENLFILFLELSDLHPIYLQTFFLKTQLSVNFTGFENELKHAKSE